MLIKACLLRSREVEERTSGISGLVCDVDSEAIRACKTFESNGFRTHLGDFLSLSPDVADQFDVVIANPPFTRNHSIDPTKRRELRERFKLSGAAGIWVPFLLHATSFLRMGGRLAAVAPASAVFTRYGQDMLSRLCAQFDLVAVCQLTSRTEWIGTAEERGCLIFAEGRSAKGSASWETIQYGEHARDSASGEGQSIGGVEKLMAASHEMTELGEFSIGAVTGRNSVFLLSEQERVAFGIQKRDVRSVVSRAKHIRGTTISTTELRQLANAGEKTWVLYPAKLSPSVEARLSMIPKPERSKVVWFSKRSPWWKVDLGNPCDAIFTYMNHRGPRLVLTKSRIFCTNTLHRFSFHKGIAEEQRASAALSLLSSFGQLMAEELGRAYGGGALKFELSDARKLPVILSTKSGASGALAEADVALRAGDYELATQIADQFLMPPILGRSWKKSIAGIQSEVKRRRMIRHSSSKRANNG